MENIYLKRNFLCIDLKSFFASCECLKRRVDPFTYPLVVANKEQGNGAITLAVTPALKNKGVPSRGRIYEIPKNIKYEIVNPNMSYYIKKSKEVVSVYLEYVDTKDLHIYSIDECFLDVTDYLKLYKKSDYELALEILEKVKVKTGLYATCGIGPNMLLAKVAMDIEAKHNQDFIAKWSYEDIPSKLWKITPLSKMWGIGKHMEAKLNRLNIYSVGELANYDKDKLTQKFGVMGRELWFHANGIDLSRINDYERGEDKSYSHSQVLFKDYNGENIKIIIREMVDVITARLRENKKVSQVIGLGIGFSKNMGGGFHHQIKLDNPTGDSKVIYEACLMILDKFYNEEAIRKVTISCGALTNDEGRQLNIFEEFQEVEDKKELEEAVDVIKKRYGKNALLKASSLLKDSTIKERNQKIGGHHA